MREKEEEVSSGMHPSAKCFKGRSPDSTSSLHSVSLHSRDSVLTIASLYRQSSLSSSRCFSSLYPCIQPQITSIHAFSSLCLWDSLSPAPMSSGWTDVRFIRSWARRFPGNIPFCSHPVVGFFSSVVFRLSELRIFHSSGE